MKIGTFDELLESVGLARLNRVNEMIDNVSIQGEWDIKVVRADGEASWSFWDRDTGITTGYRDFLAAKGLAAVSTPQTSARIM